MIAVDGPEVMEACAKLGWPSGPRPLQKNILADLLAGRDVLGVLPTGGGKSGIFQIPALARPGLVIVISPLVALMRDQVERLTEHDVPAVTLNSHSSAVERRAAQDMLRSGSVKLLYVSPERMLGMDPAMFGDHPIQMYVIDEAHCISEWGHDFRPAYWRLGRSLSRFPDAQRLALTATATSEVMDEIASITQISQRNGVVHRYSSDRPNITYGVAGRSVSLVRLVQAVGLPCIVYGSTRKGVEDAASQLQRARYKAAFYHAGMGKNERADVQAQFTNGEVDVITATNAFGMGIDHPGINGVVHLEMPTSLEAYSQETGRAGRGGQPAKVLCRATVETLEVAKSLVPMTWPSPHRIRLFWDRFLVYAEDGNNEWVGENRVQLSSNEIGHQVGMDPQEVNACLRILSEHGYVRRTPYRDRPVKVSLLSGADKLKGKRQRRVIAQLKAHADTSGEVVGSVQFFRDVIDLDLAYAKELRNRNAIRLDWVDKCQVLEILREGRPELDEDRIVAIRRRAMGRIQAAHGLLTTRGCRRTYLLEYFGDEAVSPPLGRCCDRCVAQS
jgi:ATP-dependent DNA helicase RecQ